MNEITITIEYDNYTSEVKRFSRYYDAFAYMLNHKERMTARDPLGRKLSLVELYERSGKTIYHTSYENK